MNSQNGKARSSPLLLGSRGWGEEALIFFKSRSRNGTINLSEDEDENEDDSELGF